jgi:guanylate kinase
VIAMRIENAGREMAQRDVYRHVVVNDDLETAITELIHLIDSYRNGG